ncbi:hypothetical protein Vadar_019322 [Vaccinium darrowii]|uniref:Uncharacterized protein n=1 Tax=Vaccinium darrowii TaxID=229202 RepID=A0ACB7XAT8_9ERIC|nr:hypothetical protein Vadar_019322 [Vaccinium darrowii]
MVTKPQTGDGLLHQVVGRDPCCFESRVREDVEGSSTINEASLKFDSIDEYRNIQRLVMRELELAICSCECDGEGGIAEELSYRPGQSHALFSALLRYAEYSLCCFKSSLFSKPKLVKEPFELGGVLESLSSSIFKTCFVCFFNAKIGYVTCSDLFKLVMMGDHHG